MTAVKPGPRGPEDAEVEPALWRRPVPIGYVAGFTSFATIAAPLLAGFSLTAIVTLSGSSDNRGTRGDIAISAFSAATVLMLFTLQAGIAAGQRAVLPDQRAAQYPEARSRLGWMQTLRNDQWRDERLAWRIYARCRWTYNLGIIAFLSGLITLLIPSTFKWDLNHLHTIPAFRWPALAIAVIALAIEIILTFRWPTSVSGWLVPGSAGPPVKLRNVTEEPDDMDLMEAQRLAFGDEGQPNKDDSSIGSAAVAFVAVTSALHSLATRLADLNQMVERSTDATFRQTQTAQAQLALARQDSERRSLAATALRRANIEVTGPYEQEPPTPGEQRWKILNHGPAVARGVHLELPPVTAEWLGQDVRLISRQSGLAPEELGDLQVGEQTAVCVAKAAGPAYPVSIALHWTDDDGPHHEYRHVGRT
jgi:hypothetical protein